MKQLVFASVGQPRFRTAVLVRFALLALFTSIGLYGVMSYLLKSTEKRIRLTPTGHPLHNVHRATTNRTRPNTGIGEVRVGRRVAAASKILQAIATRGADDLRVGDLKTR